MAKKTEVVEKKEVTVGKNELAEAMVAAIEAARPKKITAASRKPNTPWTPKDGSPKLKLKRKMYQHGIPISETRSTNERIELLNKVRPGVYCDGFVRVDRRKDRGINITYPVKTASHRLKLINDFQITSLEALLRRLIEEAENPVKYKPADELDY